MNRISPRRSAFHADRVAGRDRHHRHPDRPAAARRPEGARGGQPHAAARTTSSRSGSPATTSTRVFGFFQSDNAATAPPYPYPNTCWILQTLPYMEQQNAVQVVNGGGGGNREMDRTATRAAPRRSSPSITATSCSNSCSAPVAAFGAMGSPITTTSSKMTPSSTVRRWAFPWCTSPTPTAPPIRPWWLTSPAIPRTIPSAPRPGTTASNLSSAQSMPDNQVPQGSI